MNSREKAFEVLKDIVLGNEYSNLILRKELAGFKEEDKRFITNIVYGTLQNKDYLRYQYAHYLKNGIPRDIYILLDLSVYQLIMMDKVPHYAIINEAVQIAKYAQKGRFAGLVNAILRNVARNGIVEIDKEPFEKLAIETSHPLWIVKMWIKQYGEEITRKICLDNNQIPLNMARRNIRYTTHEEMLEEGFTQFKDECYTYNGNIANTTYFLKGKVSIQDYASQQVAKFLAPQAYDKVLDTCAAPGTKTAHMSELMDDTGRITAMDIHPHRVDLIANSLKRLNVKNVYYKVGDATQCETLFEGQLFDKILVDAPCTGYGVMKRKPDIKVHLQPEDMDGIVQIQKEILASAAKVCKVGGIMVYSTCTLNKKENENQVRTFLNNNTEFELVEEKTIFPYEEQCDGFYMAKLVRKGTEGK